jgi:hypothetical protein
MDSYCRPSLKQQTDQNFTLISFVDVSVKNYGNKLSNEIIYEIKSGKEYPRQEMIDAINWLYSGYDNIIITRLDRDDCLHKDFIANVKKHLSNGKEKYIDLKTAYTCDTVTGKTYKTERYQGNYTSPFISTYEKIRNGKIKCIPLLYSHADIYDNFPGEKANDLSALQVIHGKNISNKIDGKEVKIKMGDYF